MERLARKRLPRQGALAGHVEARAATVIRSIPMTTVVGEKQAATQGQGGQ